MSQVNISQEKLEIMWTIPMFELIEDERFTVEEKCEFIDFVKHFFEDKINSEFTIWH